MRFSRGETKATEGRRGTLVAGIDVSENLSEAASEKLVEDELEFFLNLRNRCPMHMDGVRALILKSFCKLLQAKVDGDRALV